MTIFHHPEVQSLRIETVLYALGDPVRLCIVRNLAKGEELACYAAVCGMNVAKSTQSHHFRILREAGLIRTRKEGVAYMSTLRRDDIDTRFPGLLDAVLKSAEGKTAVQCVEYASLQKEKP